MRNSVPTRACGLLFIIVFLLGGVSANAQDEEFEPVDLPDDIAAMVEAIDQEKVDYLRGDGIFGYAGSHEILFRRFRNKSAAEVEAYIDAMMRVDELMKFDPETDMASIPLNTETPGFNGWKTRRPAAFDTPREAGPININRYLGAGPKQGIPTFFNLPIALTPEDLVAGDVDVAIMGIGLDTGTGCRGAAYGPKAARAGLIYGGTGMTNLPHMHTMVSPFDELNIVDYGDVAVEPAMSASSISTRTTMPGVDSRTFFLTANPCAACLMKSWSRARISSRLDCAATGPGNPGSNGCRSRGFVITRWPRSRRRAGSL
jgi:agmatinase